MQRIGMGMALEDSQLDWQGWNIYVELGGPGPHSPRLLIKAVF